ncbi:MAG: sugar phosphate nucleotidyltransferase [Pseudomonadota bacterium]
MAGKGTRLLPLTKSVPKELLPVFDKPVVQFAIDEAIATGAQRLIVVTHRSKPAIMEYFHNDDRAVAALRKKQSHRLAEILEQTGAQHGLDVKTVFQDEALGLGHAVLCGAEHALDGPVGVILPDDVVLGTPALPEMAAAYEHGNMVAAMEVAPENVSKYGIFEMNQPAITGRRSVASGMVEKPNVEDAPSCMAAVGRYILDGGIFGALRKIPRGAGGEYQLTDAITAMIGSCELSAFPFSGQRYDCGSHGGLLAASNARFQEVSGTTARETAAA